MAFALVISILLRYFPDVIPITNASAVSYEYESKLFDKDSIMSINIVVDEDDWNDLLTNATAKEYIQCDIQINGETFQSVGIRAKGNTSLSSVASDDTTDRYSFKVEFDHYVNQQTCYGLDKLALNNIIQDATYMKEYLSYDLLSYMGIPSSLFSFADVSVNGETWGLYLALEVPEESFAARNFGASYGDLYKPESTNIGGENGMFNQGMPGGDEAANQTQGATVGTRPETPSEDTSVPMDGTRPEIPSGDTNGAMDGAPPEMPTTEGFKDFAQGNRNGGGLFGSGSGCDLVYTGDDLENYSSIWNSSVFDTKDSDHERIVEALKNISEGNLDGYLDVDTMLRYIAVNSVLVNYDSYFGNLQHNYYLYEKNGELTMLPWDYNLAFAGFQMNDATSAVNDPIDTPVSGTTLEERPLVGQVLAVEEYQEQYHKYLNQIVSEYFDSGYWEETIDKVDALISEYVKNDPSAFYTYDEYQTAVANLREFGLLRAESISGQLDGTIPSTEEGQQEAPQALIDASNLSILAMGTQGSGQRGTQGGGFTPPDFNRTTQTTEDGSRTWGNQMMQPSGANENMNGKQMMPLDRTEENKTIDLKAVAINGGCLLVASVALVFVKFYRRRK